MARMSEVSASAMSPGVEGGSAFPADGLKDVGQVGLAQVGLGGEVAGGQPAAGYEDAPQFVVLEELVGHHAERVYAVPAGGVSVAGERHGGRDYFGQGELAQPRVRLAQAGDGAGDGYGPESFEVLIVDDAGPAEVADGGLAGELVHIGRGVEGALHREADDAAAVAELIDHVSAAADAAGPGFDDADGEAGGDRGVNGVAAHLEHPHARLGGVNVLRGDHSAVRSRFGLVYRGYGWGRFCHLYLLSWLILCVSSGIGRF